MVKLEFNTEDWHWFPPYQKGYLALENNVTDEGFVINSFDDLCNYLAIWKFDNDLVYYDSIREAIVDCAMELGYVFLDANDVERDMRTYYI